MADRSDEAGDPACWAHLFEDDDEPPAAESPEPADEQAGEHAGEPA